MVVICLKIRTFVVSTTTIKITELRKLCCDLLENSYLCGINNNYTRLRDSFYTVVICLKIRTFVVSTTTWENIRAGHKRLWFAWKFVPLWYQQQHPYIGANTDEVVICLKIRTFVVSTTTRTEEVYISLMLWFAWKFVPLWYQQQLTTAMDTIVSGCDLLENSYLCGINNNCNDLYNTSRLVVICLKIRTFVVSTTTTSVKKILLVLLWFAWKFVPLWYQQQQEIVKHVSKEGCDLLENSYLCGINNNLLGEYEATTSVVICLKIRTFVVSTTTKNF